MTLACHASPFSQQLVRNSIVIIMAWKVAVRCLVAAAFCVTVTGKSQLLFDSMAFTAAVQRNAAPLRGATLCSIRRTMPNSFVLQGVSS
jgi:hypothetical protein